MWVNTAFHNPGILTKNQENSKLHERPTYAKIWFRIMKTNNEIESSSTSSNLLTGDVELAQERLDELKQTVQAEQLDAIATGDPEGFKAIVDAANQVGVDTDEVARELREREDGINTAGITKELLEMAERAEAQEPGYVFYNPRELAERRGRILEAAKKLDSDDWADVKNVAKVLNACSDAAASLRAGNMTIVADMFDDTLRDFLPNIPAGVLHEMYSSEDMEESRVMQQFVHNVLEGTQDLKVENAQVIAS